MHKITTAVIRYPGSIFARRIDWACSCGKSGSVHDGATAPTVARARRAAQRHTH